ncbi:hypothetical protein ACTXPP_14110, partial [Candidatus Corynebacterium faecigallinarum]|uniref:hypothetical protein n=1 Tax=Candidatus Corynebacterium faecigallinarum TaxID=2838528 RepID=UPI003FD0064B
MRIPVRHSEASFFAAANAAGSAPNISDQWDRHVASTTVAHQIRLASKDWCAHVRQAGVLGVLDLLLTAPACPVAQVQGGYIPGLVGGKRGDPPTVHISDPQVTPGRRVLDTHNDAHTGST